MGELLHAFFFCVPLIPLLYHRRVYRIKFSNAVEYDDWRKCFALRCVSPATISTKVTLTKPSRSESFKGNHSFEFLKEHMVSSVESTASTSSLSSSSSASVLASSSAAPSSLLSSMLSGAGKLVSSMKVSEDRRAWEPTVDSEATKKFSRSLRVSEKVFASGIVLKHEKTMNNASAASAPKQKRILLITDAPRMMFIDTIGNIARGNVDLLSDSKIEVKEVRYDVDDAQSYASQSFCCCASRSPILLVRLTGRTSR